MIDLINKKIRHGKFGVGTVVEQDERSITVQFSGRISKFVYPTAFEKFISAEDEDIADAIATELKAISEAKEAEKAEAAAKAAEEQARQEMLRKQTASKSRSSHSNKAYKAVKREVGQVLTYLVFQGDTYNEEKMASLFGHQSIPRTA